MQESHLNRLLRARNSYRSITERWTTFADDLEAFFSNPKLTGGAIQNLPAPIIDRDAKTIALSFTDIVIECRFEALEQGSVLAFGHYREDPLGRGGFVEHSRVYSDGSGNILDDKSGSPTMYCLTSPEVIESVFFAKCCEVLESVWAKR